MSGRTENKKISRPKVSFSQSEQAKAETTRQHEDETTRLESKSHNAPKIRSSTTLDVPVIDPKKAASDKLVSSSECKTDGSAHTGDIMSENVETKLEARATAVQDRPSTAEALCVVRGARKDVKEKPKLLPQLESTIDNIKKNYVNLKQKEKKDMAKGGKPQAAPARGVARAGNQTSKPGVANVRSTISSLDPGCTPYHKIMANSKLFPVKKSICSDVSEARIKEQFVHIIQPLHRQNKASSTFYIGSNLEHPKCNSIECIGDNLRKLQQQKIVAKMNDLSSLQKSLVVGKVRRFRKWEITVICETEEYLYLCNRSLRH